MPCIRRYLSRCYNACLSKDLRLAGCNPRALVTEPTCTCVRPFSPSRSFQTECSPPQECALMSRLPRGGRCDFFFFFSDDGVVPPAALRTLTAMVHAWHAHH